MQTRKRLLSLLLCGAMLFSLCTPLVYAEAQAAQDSGQITVNAGGLCEHHTEHNEDCGYTEGEPGTPCTHEHSEDCYAEITECVHQHDEGCYLEGAGNDNGEERQPENCPHACSKEDGCITENLNCQHGHSSECGYVPATEGAPCGFVCKECNPQDSEEIKPPAPSNGEKTVTAADIQAKIDELPEAVTEGNSEEVRRLLEEIFSLYEELSEKEQEKVDLTRCMELQAALEPGNLLTDDKILFDGLTIGGTKVTKDHMTDVLGDDRVSYEETEYNAATITLTNCKLPEGKIEYKGNSGGNTLTIELVGENSLKMIDVGCYSLVIQGSGSLTIQNDAGSCIYQNASNVVISDGATVTLTASEVGNSYGIYTPNTLEISGGSTVNITKACTGLHAGIVVSIKEGSKVNILSSNEFGICSLNSDQGKVEITGSTVNVEAEKWGIYSSKVIEISDSTVKAESTDEWDGESYFQGMHGGADVTITNCTGGKEVTAISASDCGIWSYGGMIKIDNSKVTAQGYNPGLSGKNGITIQNNSDVAATSSGNYGIYSPATVEIDKSKVTAGGYYPALGGGWGCCHPK